MKVVKIPVELTEREEQMIFSISLEKLIDQTIEILDKSSHPDSIACEGDWKHIKLLANQLWLRTQIRLLQKEDKHSLDDVDKEHYVEGGGDA